MLKEGNNINYRVLHTIGILVQNLGNTAKDLREKGWKAVYAVLTAPALRF